ncbi:hypothetical protein D3C81_2129550 [compost metagenome]|uniref:Uncharacterized protein n=1 Tax=Fontibacillus panacisegetis TaxID=670482 RepID=A0A1G7HR90_9BACL|nr:hypothetical protein [Fontibacillus panacisegetis]SDF02970.1 hypothetical protein SAMN04488542_1056 [Fontibacillus panacisegetis]
MDRAKEFEKMFSKKGYGFSDGEMVWEWIEEEVLLQGLDGKCKVVDSLNGVTIYLEVTRTYQKNNQLHTDIKLIDIEMVRY